MKNLVEDKLSIVNKELIFQNEEKEKRAAELSIANTELAFQNKEKEKRAAELSIANIELAFQNEEKEKRAAELGIANTELAFQNEEKEKRAGELGIANKELIFQNNEKEKRAAELSIANRELAFQNAEKEKRAQELHIANKELLFQNEEKEKRAAELGIANKELAFQNDEKEKRAAEKERRAEELIIANKELAFQNDEKEKRAAELIIANKELAFQNEEKEKRAAELIIANKELAFQNEEKEKRAAELSIANKELLFQNEEKEKRAAELHIANKELAFQNEEKEKRAAELIIANYARSLIEASLDPLVTISATGKILDVNEASIKVTGVAREKLINTDFSNYFTEPKKAQEGYRQVFEKGFVADYPLTIKHKNGNLTDVLYNASVYKDDKGNVLGVFAAARDVTEQKWAKDLRIANKELAFQNDEKEKRAAELSIANTELAFQNKEKEKRAAELSIANKELAFQNEEKEKRAAELSIANKELAFQNEEKEKRAAELIIANKELLAFTYISSHDLQEPLRKIQTFVTIVLENESVNLSEKGKYNLERMQLAAGRMQQLIDDLLAFSRISTTELVFEKVDLKKIINEVKADLKDTIQEKNATIEDTELCSANIIAFQFRQLMYNLISNALKFSKPDLPSHIVITGCIAKGSKLNNKKLSPDKNYCHITVKDNGIGFEPRFNERIFGVFQKLHGKDVYAGTGIGLAIVKKIVENHNGIITATGELNKGAQFDIYIPA